MRHLLPLLLTIGCTAPSAHDDDTDAASGAATEWVGAMDVLDFARATPDGVARGFDLDGVDGACGFNDYVDPDGRPGIDNVFATLLPLMEQVGGAAFEDLIQGTVDSGEFLLVVRVRQKGTECAGLDVFRASEPPLVGADGHLLTGQTLPVRDGGPLLTTECATYEDEHTVVARGLSLPLSLSIFQVPIHLTLELASLRIHLNDDGTGSGEAGGAISVDDLWSQIGDVGGIGTQLLGVLETVLFQKADISLDGGATCTHMSATLAFEAQTVFIYEGVDAQAP